MKKITIGIPTKITNPIRRDYLYECIDSILTQSNPNWELIISDDNSLIEVDWDRYKKYENIHIYHQKESLGIFGNFNFCLNTATTDLFFPLSDDDLIEQDFVEKVIHYFDQDTQDTDMLCFNFYCIRGNGDIYTESNIDDTFSSKGEDSMNKAVKYLFNSTIPKMYIHSIVKRESILKLGGYPDHGMITDGLLPYIFPLYLNIGFTCEYLVRIRHHENNRGGINNVDILREEKIKLNEYIKGIYFEKLSAENQTSFLRETNQLQSDHICLLIQFKNFGRIIGISEFFKKKITIRNTIILLFGIFFGKKIHKYFIFFTNYYTETQYKLLSLFKKQ